jgi:hypothetical protein
MFLLGAIIDQGAQAIDGKITLDSERLDRLSTTMGWGIKTSASEDGKEFYIEKTDEDPEPDWMQKMREEFPDRFENDYQKGDDTARRAYISDAHDLYA